MIRFIKWFFIVHWAGATIAVTSNIISDDYMAAIAVACGNIMALAYLKIARFDIFYFSGKAEEE